MIFDEVNSLAHLIQTMLTPFQLDTNRDGQLSFEEFKVLFDNADKRRKNSQKHEQPLLLQTTNKVS